MSSQSSVVVVTPIYEDVEAASRLCKELHSVLGNGCFIVAVDDGSVRQPVSPNLISDAGLNGVVLQLKRNVGHQRAIAVGISYVADVFPNACCVVMDSDGEDMPLTIPMLTRLLENSSVDVAVAKRRNRTEAFSFRVFYVIYKRLFRFATGRSINFGNFMAMKPLAIRRLAAMQEVSTHVAGSVLVSKLRIAFCPIDRGTRYAGQSKMNFAGLVLHGFRAFMVSAEDVLVRAGIACIMIAALSLAGIVASIFLKFLGFATPGWFSLSLGILFIVLLQTSALSLMTLLLTGAVRGGGAVSKDYEMLIGRIFEARTNAEILNIT